MSDWRNYDWDYMPFCDIEQKNKMIGRIEELEAEKLDWELHLKDMKKLTDDFFKDITPYMETYE